MARPVQPTSGAIRAANRANVVRVLRHVGSATREELVQQTRLSRATVSSLLGELRARGLVSELRDGVAQRSGRPPAKVSLNKSAGVAFAVDIGVRHVAVAVGDLSRSVLAERWTTLPQGHTSVRGTKLVLKSIEEAVAQASVQPEQLVGAAISIAAPVAAGSGQLAVPGVLPGWNGSKLAECVAARWSIPVVTENDANLGALGEAVSRPVADGGDLLYVKVASRIGLGIARGTSIIRGRDGYAGELGHVTARPNGVQCWCGRRGCLGLYAGGDGLLRRLPSGAGVSTVAELATAAASDREVRRAVHDGALMLARALADVALVLNPSRIVLGGELTALGELLAGPIRRELEGLPFGSRVDFAVSPLGERASLVGALALVLTEPGRFADRSQLARPKIPSLPSREGSRR